MTAPAHVPSNCGAPAGDGQGVQQSAEERLARSGYGVLKSVRCNVELGVLFLSGTLPSYYLKQMAQAVVANLEGIRLVINQIDVADPAHKAPAPSWRARDERDSVSGV
jgi:osmotically-inducible protein OsmY